ncbi:MAG: thiamine biosynthesis lipoprotein, partial [Polaribacter sp.]
MKLQKIITFITFLLILLACNQEKKNSNFTLQGHVFGTTYKITYFNTNVNYQKS